MGQDLKPSDQGNPLDDLKGKTHMKEREKTKRSFDDCVKHHLLTIFSDDAAEKQVLHKQRLEETEPGHGTSVLYASRTAQQLCCAVTGSLHQPTSHTSHEDR